MSRLGLSAALIVLLATPSGAWAFDLPGGALPAPDASGVTNLVLTNEQQDRIDALNLKVKAIRAQAEARGDWNGALKDVADAEKMVQAVDNDPLNTVLVNHPDWKAAVASLEALKADLSQTAAGDVVKNLQDYLSQADTEYALASQQVLKGDYYRAASNLKTIGIQAHELQDGLAKAKAAGTDLTALSFKLGAHSVKGTRAEYLAGFWLDVVQKRMPQLEDRANMLYDKQLKGDRSKIFKQWGAPFWDETKYGSSPLDGLKAPMWHYSEGPYESLQYGKYYVVHYFSFKGDKLVKSGKQIAPQGN